MQWQRTDATTIFNSKSHEYQGPKTAYISVDWSWSSVFNLYVQAYKEATIPLLIYGQYIIVTAF